MPARLLDVDLDFLMPHPKPVACVGVACLLLACPFFRVPTTSKCLLRRLQNLLLSCQDF